MKNIKNCIVLIILSIFFTSCTTNNIVLENDYFKYMIAVTGTNLKFVDKVTGTDYLDPITDSKCANILIDSVKYEVTSLSLEGDQLKMEFGETGVSVDVKVIKADDRITLKIASVTGKIESWV